jgi:hypothetical protein
LRGFWRALLAAEPSPAEAGALVGRLLPDCATGDWAPAASGSLAVSVAGIDGFQLGGWAERHRTLLAAVAAPWLAWLQPYAQTRVAAGQLARFATRAAAEAVRDTLLSWLAEFASGADGSEDVALGELLSWLPASGGLLRELSPAGDHARAILAALLGRGDRVAMVLSEQLR